MKPREKRIARAELQRQQQIEKRAVLIQKALASAKQVVSKPTPPSAQAKQATHRLGKGYFNLVCDVSSKREDREGQWSWGVLRDWHKTCGRDRVEGFLANYQGKKTWREIHDEKTVGKNNTVKLKHVSYAVSDICSEAQKRLMELSLDDQDEIFRFRLSSMERLYGFRIGATFSTVWFDPTHEIFPLDD